MALGQNSGTYNFASQYSVGDVLFDAFERCGKIPAELTQQQLVSGRRSLNLVLQSFANGLGPMLWAVPQQPLVIVLQQGISTITLPKYVSSVMDVYCRQYLNTQTVNQTAAFTTAAGSATVNVFQPMHGLSVGQAVFVITQVSVGGLILSGYYTVIGVPDQNDFTVTAASSATSSVTSAGTLPQFVTTNSSQNVTVNFANHGQTVGSSFNVPVSVSVGGITLAGSYMVTSVTNANTFVINSAQTATSNASSFLNGNQVQLTEQTSNSVPTDRVLTPMSRTDYADLPYKAQQGFPYTFWVTRVQPATMTLWQTPDQNGPYLLSIYYLRQLQDANLGMAETPDVQYRGLEMLTSRLASKLAVKFAPDKYEMLKAEANEEYTNFSEENREKVALFVQPEINRYFRM